jgi:hypothetical protein
MGLGWPWMATLPIWQTYQYGVQESWKSDGVNRIEATGWTMDGTFLSLNMVHCILHYACSIAHPMKHVEPSQ